MMTQLLSDIRLIPLTQDQINAQGLSAVPALITNAISVLLVIAGSLSIIFIIVGGLRYVLSAGDPKAVQEAKQTITYAIIGLIITLLSVFIVNFATGIFK